MRVKLIPFHERITKRPTKVKDFYRLLFIPLPYYFQGFDRMTKTTYFEKDYKNLLKDIKDQKIQAKELPDFPDQSNLQNFNLVQMLKFADNLMCPPKDRLLKKYQCILFYKILIEPFVKSFLQDMFIPPAFCLSDDLYDDIMDDLPFD